MQCTPVHLSPYYYKMPTNVYNTPELCGTGADIPKKEIPTVWIGPICVIGVPKMLAFLTLGYGEVQPGMQKSTTVSARFFIFCLSLWSPCLCGQSS